LRIVSDEFVEPVGEHDHLQHGLGVHSEPSRDGLVLVVALAREVLPKLVALLRGGIIRVQRFAPAACCNAPRQAVRLSSSMRLSAHVAQKVWVAAVGNNLLPLAVLELEDLEHWRDGSFREARRDFNEGVLAAVPSVDKQRIVHVAPTKVNHVLWLLAKVVVVPIQVSFGTQKVVKGHLRFRRVVLSGGISSKGDELAPVVPEQV